MTSKSVGTGPSSYEKKNNLPGSDLTKIEKHWSKHLGDMKGAFKSFARIYCSFYNNKISTLTLGR